MELLRQMAMQQPQQPQISDTTRQGQALAALSDAWTGSRFSPVFAQMARQEQAQQVDPFDRLRQVSQLEQYGLQNELARERLNLAKNKAASGGGRGSGSSEPKAYKQNQYQAAGFGLRMEEATKELENVISGGYDPTTFESGAERFSPLFEQFKSPGAKQYTQAQRNFINANLRRESGAAIADSEFKNAERQYFPQVGDTKEVLAQKARNRKQAISQMKAEAGGAFDQVRQTYAKELEGMEQPSVSPQKEAPSPMARPDLEKSILEKFKGM